ncbi:hypothetical protein TNCT_373601 [Trichonephila clavata]|uniref:Uncharacterized protein n=1 Tax=Trichonephila clavata TaxID=2740835 RepID=A0A8X6FRY6_TRICU|nr:hypothetical protein TNCT_373601 [Trichonephila clavata]
MVYNLTIYQDWDILKKRCVPQTSQEFVDSKQRLRAALRNIKTITEISQKNGYRKYMITEESTTLQRKERKKIQRSDSSSGLSCKEKYIQQKKKMNFRKERLPLKERNPVIKKEPIVKEVEKDVLSENNPLRIKKRKRAIAEEGNKVLSENNPLRIKKRKKAIAEAGNKVLSENNPLRIKKRKKAIAEAGNKVLSPSLHLETNGMLEVKEKGVEETIPRELLDILESNVHYGDIVIPKRRTKVSQEVWASSLELPAQLPRRSGRKKTLVSNVNNVEQQNHNSPASIPKVSTVNNVKQDETSSAQTSTITVSTVNVTQEPTSSVQTSEVSTLSTSNNGDEELASPASIPKKNTGEVQLLNLKDEKELLQRILKSNCEQKVPPDWDFESFDEYLIDPEENSSPLGEKTFDNDESAICPPGNVGLKYFGHISEEIWNRNK